jgi:hypothetical protein
MKFLFNLFVLIAYCRYRYIYIIANKSHNTEVKLFIQFMDVDCRIQEAQQDTGSYASGTLLCTLTLSSYASYRQPRN